MHGLADRPTESRAEIGWRIAKLAGPSMLSRFGVLALSVVDSVMVGRIGVDQLAYLAVAAQPQHSFLAVGQGFVADLTPKVVESQMRRNDREAAQWLASALIVSAVLGLLLGGILALGEMFCTPGISRPNSPPRASRSFAPLRRACRQR